MSVLNWLAAKALGVPTVSKNCDDGVLVFLTKHGIDSPKFDFFEAGRSQTNARFNYRLYFGTGHRARQEIGFVLHVNEDVVRPYGAIVDPLALARIRNIYDKWLSYGTYRGQLYGFALDELGGAIANLDAFDRT